MKQPTSVKSKLRRDGSVTWWSVFEQRWLTGWDVPPRDLRAMSPAERARVAAHLAKARAKHSAALARKAKGGRRGRR